MAKTPPLCRKLLSCTAAEAGLLLEQRLQTLADEFIFPHAQEIDPKHVGLVFSVWRWSFNTGNPEWVTTLGAGIFPSYRDDLGFRRQARALESASGEQPIRMFEKYEKDGHVSTFPSRNHADGRRSGAIIMMDQNLGRLVFTTDGLDDHSNEAMSLAMMLELELTLGREMLCRRVLSASQNEVWAERFRDRYGLNIDIG